MIATSPDGQWAAVRRGRELGLWAGGSGVATARITLPTDDADLAIVGPPSVVAVVTRGASGIGEPGHRMVLYQPPYLDAVARLDLDVAMRIAAITGPRIVLVSLDGKAVKIVRVAGRALAAQTIEPGSPVELAVGLDRNQVLFGLFRKLESWDAVSGRPLLRMQLQLPPAPRTVGPAYGHVWATRPGGDDILVYRMSDGRPFRHQLGVAIDEVIYHASSPLLILVTARGLVRLHCFAHSLTVIDAPWQPGTLLGQLVVGEDISLLGVAPHDDALWRVPIGGAGAPAITLEAPDGSGAGAPSPLGAPGAAMVTAADKLRAMRERTGFDPPDRGERAGRPERDERGDRAEPADRAELASAGPAAVWPTPAPAARRSAEPQVPPAWRAPLAAFAAELARGGERELPVVAADTELGQLAERLELPFPARRALVALYGLYLVGEPAVAIARLAHAIGDWTEALGQGELGALALLRRRGGTVALRSAVTDLLDGAGPRAIRVVGGGAAVPRAGASRLPRDGRSDAAIETALISRLGRVAIVEGGAACALLEARLYGATAVALAPPATRPLPWPRDAGLVIVTEAEPAAPTWVAALPVLTAA